MVRWRGAAARTHTTAAPLLEARRSRDALPVWRRNDRLARTQSVSAFTLPAYRIPDAYATYCYSATE